MTHDTLRISAIALGVAALVSSFPVSASSADPSALGETLSPLGGAAAAPGETTSASSHVMTSSGVTAVRRADHYRRYARHHRYGSGNPVVAAAEGVVGGIADLGAIAAYPVYCWPHYGTCPVFRPY